MGLRFRGPEVVELLEYGTCHALVHGQHRLPPRPSPQCTYSFLPPARGDGRDRRAPRARHHELAPGRDLPLPAAEALGPAEEPAGELRGRMKLFRKTEVAAARMSQARSRMRLRHEPGGCADGTTRMSRRWR